MAEQKARHHTTPVETTPPGAAQSVDVKAVDKPVEGKCANHPDRDAVFTTAEDTGFAQTSFCKECADSLPPGPVRTAYQKQQSGEEEK